LIGRKIGAGSFGSILLGTDLQTGKYVAVKFVCISIEIRVII
jgi:serine/threonine protein kinase